MSPSTRNQILWVAAFLLALSTVLWTTRYRVVTSGAHSVVLYDRWTHRLCASDGKNTACGARLP